MANLGDVLAGAAGAPVNRPALNAYIAQGQAMAGLRTAQTDDALVTAQAASERQQAYAQMPQALVGAGWQPSQAQAMTNYAQATGRDPKEIFDAYQSDQQGVLTNVIADPNAPSEARVGAMQALKRSFNVGQTTPVNGQLVNNVVPSTATQPPVQQTPASEAINAKNNAQARLFNTEAENPTAFHPNQNQLSPQVMQGVLNYIHQNPGAAPTGYALTRGPGAVIGAALGDEHQPAPGAPNTGTGVAAAPGVSYQEQADIRKGFANGVPAAQVRSLNTMYQHSQLFDEIANQIQTGNFQPTNQINIAWQKLFGKPAPTNLNIAASFLGREAIRATVNSGAGTGEERELQIGSNPAPDVLHGAADTLRTLVGGQLHSLDLQARRGGVDLSTLLSPEARQAYGMASPQAPQQGAQGQQAAGPQNPLASLALAELARRAHGAAAPAAGAQ